MFKLSVSLKKLSRSRAAVLFSVLFSFMFFCTPLKMSAQKFLWDVDFKFGFDNREYSKLDTPPSGTLFGAYIQPKVGLGFGEGHSVNVGVDFGRLFGKEAYEPLLGKTYPKYDLEVLLYYQYKGPHLFVNAGAYPSRSRTGYYPAAFTGDDRYFDNVFEGAVVRYSRRDWMLEGVADWMGCFDKNTREQFCIYSSGQYKNADFPYIYASYSFMMHHFANSGTVRGVVDNIWIYPYLGLDFKSLAHITKLGGRIGWINTFQNNRIDETGYQCPGGFQLELEAEYWGFGLRNTLYLGKNLQPFFNTQDASGNIYGDNLYLGCRFYGTDSGLYNCLELYWNYHLNDMLTVYISSVQHCVGNKWGWQQFVRLTVNLNHSQFSMKKKNKVK